jgi:hypothetical protein
MVLASLVAAAAFAAAPPQSGVVVPGASFGGLRLGTTQAQVRAAWGTRFGRCRRCAEPTWYYNYADFRPQGVGVSFDRGRVDAVFTIWTPPGWATSDGIRIGDPVSRVTEVYGPLAPVTCAGYTAYLRQQGQTQTVVYVQNDVVFGFALTRAAAEPCR